MMDLITFKHELRLAVSSLARALLPLTDRHRDQAPPGGTAAPQVKQTAQVDALCAETVDRILKMVELELEKQKNPVQAEEQDAGGAAGRSELSHVLLHRKAAGERPQELLQVNANANTIGQVKSCPPSVRFPDHEYARLSPLLHSSASATGGGASATGGGASAAGGGASAAMGGASAARSRKQSCTRRKHAEDVSVGAEEEAGPQPLCCPLCRKLFPNSERLSEHHRKWHRACSVCGILFSGVLRLREHEFREHGRLPHACDFCPKRFKHKAHRDRHVKSCHSGEKSCRCAICGRGYATASALASHWRTHFSKTFTCDVCGKSFFHGSHLTRHKVLHQDGRPFSCSVCGRGFTQAANLRSHQDTHGAERQLCSVCGKSFRCLRKHVLSRHGGGGARGGGARGGGACRPGRRSRARGPNKTP